MTHATQSLLDKLNLINTIEISPEARWRVGDPIRETLLPLIPNSPFLTNTVQGVCRVSRVRHSLELRKYHSKK